MRAFLPHQIVPQKNQCKLASHPPTAPASCEKCLSKALRGTIHTRAYTYLQPPSHCITGCRVPTNVPDRPLRLQIPASTSCGRATSSHRRHTSDATSSLAQPSNPLLYCSGSSSCWLRVRHDVELGDLEQRAQRGAGLGVVPRPLLQVVALPHHVAELLEADLAVLQAGVTKGAGKVYG